MRKAQADPMRRCAANSVSSMSLGLCLLKFSDVLTDWLWCFPEDHYSDPILRTLHMSHVGVVKRLWTVL